jgi:transposase InsO family protein
MSCIKVTTSFIQLRIIDIMTATRWSNEAIDKQLANLYYAPGDPASYGGVERLLDRARELNIPVDRSHVIKFLNEQATYQLHKPARHTFLRNQTLVAHIDEQWQADLADMSNISKENDAYTFLLTCVDILSRYAWVIPVRSKSAAHMLIAIRQLFKRASPRKPTRLQTDKGKEFHNASVRTFLRQQGVELFSTNSDHKAAIVERFNRTLKHRIYKHFTAYNTRRYVDVLPDIVYSYNNSYHRTTGQRPRDITTIEDENKVWRRVYYDNMRHQNTKTKQLPTAGDRVRLSRWKGTFEKGYVPNWSREHYEVMDVRPQRRGGIPRPVYKLKDMLDEDIEGACYPEEIQRVPEAAVHIIEIERVLRQREHNKQVEYLVKFKGWPNKFNRWLTAAELQQYQKPLRQQQP